MNEFKPGDKVICINDKGTSGPNCPIKGEVYTVCGDDEFNSQVLRELGPYGWFKRRFELWTGTNEVKDTNPKDGAATSRLDMTLVPQSAIAYAALAFTEGALKYGGFNWRVAGVRASVYVAACLRHLFKWYNGEEEDPKTGVPHLANALACLSVLVDAIEAGKLNDDRPPRQEMAGLLERFEAKVKALQGMFKSPPARHQEKKT